MLATNKPLTRFNAPSKALRRPLVPQRLVAALSTETEAPPAPASPPLQPVETGFVGYDTAGQANMYPVVTKAYEAKAFDSSTSNVVGGAAAVIALGVFGVAAALLSGGGSAPQPEYLSLAEYAAKFAAEL